MTDPVLHYTRVSEEFDSRLAQVEGEQWSAQTPCSDWDVRALVDHVIHTHHMILSTLGHKREAPRSGDDLLPFWKEARQAVLDALSDDAVASQMVMSPFGELPFRGLAGGILSSDTLFHSWDLARATGQDETLDVAACERVLEVMEPMDAMLRAPGLFGDRLDASGDADAQTRMLAFGGRQV